MTDTIDIPDLVNQLHPEPGYVTGGQPTPEQLETAARNGIRRVINLRPPTEDAGYDEAEQADQLGLEYTVLPIAGAPDLTRDNAEQLDALLAGDESAPTLVHCASGNRVGALMALRAAWVHGKSADEALAIGRRWGLTRAEAAVASLLGEE